MVCHIWSRIVYAYAKFQQFQKPTQQAAPSMRPYQQFSVSFVTRIKSHLYLTSCLLLNPAKIEPTYFTGAAISRVTFSPAIRFAHKLPKK